MKDDREQHRTQPSDLKTETIPIIDLSDPDEELVARSVVKVSEEWGIFHVVNHGISTDLIQRLKEVGKQFFELPETEKNAIEKQDGSKDYEGYTSSLKKAPGDTENVFHRIWPPSCINFSYWPKNPLHYREVVEEYTEGTKKLSEIILGFLSEGLGLQRDVLKKALGGKSTEYAIRINNYPPNPQSDLALGGPEHTDIIGITIIIFNEVPGLQILKDDRWFDVNYIPSVITVIIGDQITRISNGKYKNVMHRVILDKENQRMSWPFFVDANPDVVIRPLPELISNDNPSKFKPITCKDFKYRRLHNLPID